MKSASFQMDNPAVAVVSPSDSSLAGKWRGLGGLFLISFLILFFELTCIRWFASTVVFLTFFTNLVLMACFLGMTTGCLIASRPRDYIRSMLPLTLITVAAALTVVWAYNHFGQVAIDVGGQRSPQVVYFGTEYRAKDPSKFLIPIEVIAGLFFVLIAGMFLGLGQVLGRAFNSAPDRVAAYTANLLGSLAGIGAFAGAAYLHTTPHFWFAVCVAGCLWFTRPWTAAQVFSQIGLLLLIAITAYGIGEKGETQWSPYYKIQYNPRTANIEVNGMAHQAMQDITKFQGAYAVPHDLNRGIGQPPFQDMLIIGAGSGNDVAMALSAGVGHIDAVEIDPSINRIGREDHPNHPFDDPRVSLHYDDGRSFVHKTAKQYDLIVYALVDSLVLHSGYSSLRLESFLFTEEAFRDIRARLKPGGMFVMYNFYRQGWIVARLDKMAGEVFGAKPLVISLPYQARISPEDSQADHFTVIMAGNGVSDKTDAMRKNLLENLARNPGAAAEKTFLGPAEVDAGSIRLLPTDDWPFLYLKNRAIPFKPSVTGMILIAALSAGFLLAFSPGGRLRPNGQMFFLGAGFMLLETRGVVQMALLFGSTWVVNSVVFAAILVMALLSNLTVLAFKPGRLWPFYVALGVGLLLNLTVPLERFLALGGSARALTACAFVFVPIYFAGIIFAVAFRDSRQPDMDFGSNIGGVILGGLSEYFSLVVGFKWLLLIALGYYALSYALRPRLAAGA
jgi:SAM-dependent methyltransferase